MELIKENESFRINDTKENGWVLSGTVNKNSDNSVNMNFTVNKPGELETSEFIGDGYYNLSVEQRVSVSFNVDSKNETEFIDYLQVSVAEINRQLAALQSK